MSGPVVLVLGLPASGKTTLARSIGEHLGLPVLSLDSVKEALVESLDPAATADRFAVRRAARSVLVRLAGEQPRGCVVDIWVNPTRDESDFAGAVRSLPVVEVVCRVPVEVSLSRYAARDRHPAHLPADADSDRRIREAAPGIGPLGLGPHVEVDTASPVEGEALARLLDWLREQGVAA